VNVYPHPATPLPLPVLLPQSQTVISTEAAHSLTVRGAAEKPASLPNPSPRHRLIVLYTPHHPPTPHPFTIKPQPLIPLTPPPRPIAALALLAILASLTLHAQQPRTLIFLDPAHGGPEAGAHLPNNLLEKDLTLTFAARLRAALTTSGFTIISTRDADPTIVFTTDQRAEIANHAHPAACLILHATASGNGIHLVTSALPGETFDSIPNHNAIPWDTAQTPYLTQSLRLSNELGVALVHAKIPVLLTRASVRPLDNLTCPAVAIEIAPRANADDDPTPVTNAAYQQSIAQSIAAALTSWRTHNPPAPGPAR
jgi:N-acetylmuramoyl-L-alanine amidase